MGQYSISQLIRQIDNLSKSSRNLIRRRTTKQWKNCVKLQVHFSDCQMRSLLRLEEERGRRGEKSHTVRKPLWAFIEGVPSNYHTYTALLLLLLGMLICSHSYYCDQYNEVKIKNIKLFWVVLQLPSLRIFIYMLFFRPF